MIATQTHRYRSHGSSLKPTETFPSNVIPSASSKQNRPSKYSKTCTIPYRLSYHTRFARALTQRTSRTRRDAPCCLGMCHMGWAPPAPWPPAPVLPATARCCFLGLRCCSEGLPAGLGSSPPAGTRPSQPASVDSANTGAPRSPAGLGPRCPQLLIHSAHHLFPVSVPTQPPRHVD